MFKFRTSKDRQTKENPAKGRVSRLLIGRVALFPLREEALLTQLFCVWTGTVPVFTNTKAIVTPLPRAMAQPTPDNNLTAQPSCK